MQVVGRGSLDVAVGLGLRARCLSPPLLAEAAIVRLRTMAPPSCGYGFEPSGVQVCMRVHV